jgi:hypothetical protein
MLTLRRFAALAMLTIAVVLLHGAGIGSLRFEPAASLRARAPALQARSIPPPSMPQPSVVPPASPGPPRTPPKAAQALRLPSPQPTAIAVAEPAVPTPAPLEPQTELPVYPVMPPPPVRWAYSLTRGPLTGEGVLHWQPDGERYTARFEGRIAGIAVLDWTSRGGFDTAGLAPERYVVRRRGRDAQAANFQRAAGKITYSGPTVEHPLPRGAQDRLSWMLQLPAIVAATPERFAAEGASVVLFVAGARGDADVWTFVLAGRESVSLADGEAGEALKFVREPRRAYDTRVEVWLDPARHHLPLRARLSNEGRDDTLELLHVPSP